jgi:hypothetical protein
MRPCSTRVFLAVPSSFEQSVPEIVGIGSVDAQAKIESDVSQVCVRVDWIDANVMLQLKSMELNDSLGPGAIEWSAATSAPADGDPSLALYWSDVCSATVGSTQMWPAVGLLVGPYRHG